MINLIIYLEQRKENLYKELSICNRYLGKDSTHEWQAEKERIMKAIDDIDNELNELNNKGETNEVTNNKN